MKKAALVIVVLGAVGCTFSVGISPEEICAKDRMLFAGRTYESGVTTSQSRNQSSVSRSGGQGIQCRRPETKQEVCEVDAAVASRHEKVRLCEQQPGNCEGLEPGQCTVDGSEDACEIEKKAAVIYEKTFNACQRH